MRVEPLGLERMTGDWPGIPAQLPNFTADSIYDVDFEILESLGIRHVLVDVDATIRYNWDKFIDPDVVEHLGMVRRALGSLSFSLATNNQGSIVHQFAKELGGVPAFQPYKLGKETIRKPDIRFFKRILDELGIEDPRTAVMIGDKARADIPASRLGMWTVKVEPFGPDFWFDVLRRMRSRDDRALAVARQTVLSMVENPPIVS